MFDHFVLGTFSGEEWAAPHQAPALFAPEAVGCARWAVAAAAANRRGAGGTTFPALPSVD
ncbi:hypothetical protein AB5J52_02480 [Streptomyces sp. R39]|uniref:Uncharacterized protein n=1 Tax=Streptomyces sp. R39 TaxID=3238631 RepID=A0AB39QI53_9ACTN